VPNYHYSEGNPISTEVEAAELMSRYALKFVWFASKGYVPHPYQVVFHANTFDEEGEERLCRFRHLVAGRRGGKTLSAAWETLYYVTHPEEFHWDAHHKRSERPLHVWVLTKDYPTGMAALLAFREALKGAGYNHGREYKENRGNRWFEFENGSFVQFKTADEPESLRGAGLDILWMDEAAFIPNARAWEVTRPALSDKEGLVLSTTTPDGKNWFYETFWTGDAQDDPEQGRVEYRSIDNPYFPAKEWVRARREMHPMLFKQEYMASFDSMAGKELSGDWLHYYSPATLDRKKIKDTFIGVDPAISLSDTADRFVITLVGKSEDNTQVYLLKQWAGRIPFAEQVEMIYSWWRDDTEWPRARYIGIEKNAYQAALEQQVARMEGFPPTVPIWTKGKKFERILAMAPWFRIGKVKISKDHKDFIDEWIDYDSQIKNPKDDCLDSMEIALRVAGVLLPGAKPVKQDELDHPAGSIEELRRRDSPGRLGKSMAGVDEHLGGEW
jgi:predicted phage terminase large subunit-like protein